MKYLPFQHVEILNIYKNINGVFLSNNSREQIKRRGVAMYRGLPASVWGPVSVLRISPRDHNDAADDETQKQRGIVHWKPVTIHTVQSKQAFQVIDVLNHRLSCCYFFLIILRTTLVVIRINERKFVKWLSKSSQLYRFRTDYKSRQNTM